MSICIFSGTFNPIHNAHIDMAKFALEKYKFDKIIFIPAYMPPHKDISPELATHRLNMVKLAISEYPEFELSDIEYKSDGKSYSILTVKKIMEQYSLKGKLNFIIGTDAFAKIESWYHSDELKQLVHFIVFPRHDNNDRLVFVKLKDKGWDFEIAEKECMDVSSTGIRNMTENNKLDKRVEEYIAKNGLYKS